jgi:hypothetical protein
VARKRVAGVEVLRDPGAEIKMRTGVSEYLNPGYLNHNQWPYVSETQ